MKILVTGATGLLGTDIAYTLEQAGHTTLKACFSDRGEGYIAADITTEEGIQKLNSAEWEYVVHTSAWKNPDKCEGYEEEAYRINVWASEQIALLAAKRDARMLFISTDYVFSGKNPPYNENSEKCPINYYGESKAIAEDRIKSILKDYCILRIPILYGIRAGIKASDLLNSALIALKEKKEKSIDNYVVRYPTFTEDVAEAVRFLIEKDAIGVYHFTGDDKTTKYEILKIIAETVNSDMSFIKSIDDEPTTTAPRPFDAHLSMEKLLKLGFKPKKTFKEHIDSIINKNKSIFHVE